MVSLLRSLFRGWRAAVLLVVVACATPDRATAGCGSHVVVLNPMTSFDSTEHAPRAPMDLTERPKGPQKPCSGPNCSRAPDPAPFAPAPLSAPRTMDASPVLGSADRADLSARVCESTSPRPVRRSADIFRPPPLA